MIDRNAQEWMPCPLCGTQMEETTVGSVKHPGDDCPLAQIVLFDVDDCRDAWNSRHGTDRIKAMDNITDPDFIWEALDGVHDGETTLADYAAAVSRAQRAALAASQPVPTTDDLIRRADAEAAFARAWACCGSLTEVERMEDHNDTVYKSIAALRAIPPVQAIQPAPETLNSAYNRGYEDCLYSAGQTAEPESRPVTLTYTNWKGETAARTIIPRRVWWGSTEWHPEPQWMLTAFDVDKQAERDFAMKDFGQPAQPVAVKVKPLVWAEKPTHNKNAKLLVAQSPIGEFSLEYGSWQNGQLLLSMPKTTEWLPIDVEAAKHRAQQELDDTISPLLDVQPLTVQDAARVPEIASLIEGWDNLISEAEMLRSEDADYHADGSERPDLWEYDVFVDIDTAKATLAALRAIAEGRA